MYSTISTLFIFLLLLSFLHACTGRHLRSVSEESSTSSKGFENAKAANYHHQKIDSLIPKDDDDGQKGDAAGAMNKNSSNSECINGVKKKMVSTKLGEIMSGGVPKFKPLVSVSWHINPRNDHHDERNPGFFSDYSKPRTRPPSHN